MKHDEDGLERLITIRKIKLYADRLNHSITDRIEVITKAMFYDATMIEKQ